jgi:hypothetical protein
MSVTPVTKELIYELLKKIQAEAALIRAGVRDCKAILERL